MDTADDKDRLKIKTQAKTQCSRETHPVCDELARSLTPLLKKARSPRKDGPHCLVAEISPTLIDSGQKVLSAIA